MATRNLNGRFLTAASAYLKSDVDAEVRNGIRAGLSPETERALSSATAREWYPVEQIVEVYDALRASYPDERAARGGIVQVGKLVADQAANTFMRLFMKVSTPAMLFRQFPKIWPKYADFGEFQLDSIQANQFEFSVRDLAPMKYWPLIGIGWTSYMLEAMNKKKIDIKTDPPTGILGDGVFDMRVTASWA
jgi:hypothetical protein